MTKLAILSDIHGNLPTLEAVLSDLWVLKYIWDTEEQIEILAGIIDKFYLLQKGLSIILFFIGAKMLLDIWHIEVNVYLSFTVIIATLILSIVFSVIIPRRNEAKEAKED